MRYTEVTGLYSGNESASGLSLCSESKGELVVAIKEKRKVLWLILQSYEMMMIMMMMMMMIMMVMMMMIMIIIIIIMIRMIIIIMIISNDNNNYDGNSI